MLANRQEDGMAAVLTHLFSLPLTVFPAALWNKRKTPPISAHVWVCVQAGTKQDQSQHVLTSWAGWNHSLWQRRDGRMSEQTAAGYGYRKEWAPGIFLHCVFPLLSAAVETPQPPTAIFHPQGTLSNLSCFSLILKALLGKSVGISFV